jgi:hypothetical protein
MPNEELAKQLMDQAILLSEVMVKLNAIEQLLKTKGVFSEEELGTEIKKVVAQFSEVMKAALLASVPSTLSNAEPKELS